MPSPFISYQITSREKYKYHIFTLFSVQKLAREALDRVVMIDFLDSDAT